MNIKPNEEYKHIKKHKVDPFSIKNEFNNDKLFTDLFEKNKSIEDDEKVVNKLELKQLWKVCSSKAKLVLFLSFGTLFLINLYLII